MPPKLQHAQSQKVTRQPSNLRMKAAPGMLELTMPSKLLEGQIKQSAAPTLRCTLAVHRMGSKSVCTGVDSAAQVRSAHLLQTFNAPEKIIRNTDAWVPALEILLQPGCSRAQEWCVIYALPRGCPEGLRSTEPDYAKGSCSSNILLRMKYPCPSLLKQSFLKV